MSRQQPAQAAILLIMATLVSRLLGYFRDIVLLSYFGQSNLTDAYYAAFTLPDFLYLLLVGSALGPVFIPVFSTYLAKKEEAEAWHVASSVWNIVICFMLLGLFLAFCFAPQLIHLLVPGFSSETATLATELTRIMLPQAFFLALAGIGMGILHSYNNYLAPSLGSITYNIAILLVSLLLLPYWGIHGFACGVTVGAFCYLLVELPGLYQTGWRWQPVFSFQHPGVQEILHRLTPILFGLSINQMNLWVSQHLASYFAPGILSALRLAQRLMQFPISLFAISIAVALFANMSRTAALQDYAGFRRYFQQGVGSTIFLSLPAAGGLIALGKPLLTLFYQQGAFSSQDVAVTYQILIFYCLGLVACGLQQMLNRTFYAQGDTATPVKVGTLTVIVNITLNFTLCHFLSYFGLALAYTLAGFFQTGILFFLLRQRQGPLGGRSFFVTSARSLGLTLAMMAVVMAFCILTSGFTHSKWGLLCQVIFATILGSSIYLLGARWLHMSELTILQRPARGKQK